MTGRSNEEAVSVIVGTLLLILITVTAAAGLAVMVAQLQKNEMDQQSHVAEVKSEQINITDISLTNDPQAWNQTNTTDWDQYPFTTPGNQSWKNWSSVTFILSNMNTDDVRVIGIAIGDRYSRNVSTVTTTAVPVYVRNNISQDYLTIPAARSQKIRINFTDDFSSPQYLADDGPVKIKVITSLYNTFGIIFKPPDPLFLTRVETEDLGVMQRHVLVLDGSSSTADNGIADWNWSVTSAGATVPVPGTWTDTANLTTMYNRGVVARVYPSDSGPFRIGLRVTDGAGMSAAANPVDIPADRAYVPISNVYAGAIRTTLNTTVVNVTVKDINGVPVPGVTVNFAVGSNPFNNLTFAPYFALTDSTGNASTIATEGIGTIKAIYGKFPVMEVPVGS